MRALADYEREPAAATATEGDFHLALFPFAGAAVAHAEVAEVDGRVVGMAIWFYSFSTWTGKAGIWLEDLYVEPAHRGSGLGKQLLATLAQRCVDEGLTRLEWTVLDWNAPSIAFYRSLGATAMDEWTTQRLAGEALATLAGQADHAPSLVEKG